MILKEEIDFGAIWDKFDKLWKFNLFSEVGVKLNIIII